MILRFVSPKLSLKLSPLLSLFAVPTIVGVVAVTQLVSLDGWMQKTAGLPIAVPSQNSPEKLVQQTVNSVTQSTTIAIQTEQERYNTTLSQIQAGDWLTQQGKFQAAKASYHQALSQTQHADLAATATDRLDQLSRQLALKPVVKLAIKPDAKSNVKPVIKTAIKPVVKSVAKSAGLDSKPDAKSGSKSVGKMVGKTDRNLIPQPMNNSIPNPVANPIADPSVSRSAADLLPIVQPTSPAVLPLGQLPSPETPPPAQTIVAESPQWDLEPPAQLN